MQFMYFDIFFPPEIFYSWLILIPDHLIVPLPRFFCLTSRSSLKKKMCFSILGLQNVRMSLLLHLFALLWLTLSSLPCTIMFFDIFTYPQLDQSALPPAASALIIDSIVLPPLKSYHVLSRVIFVLFFH